MLSLLILFGMAPARAATLTLNSPVVDGVGASSTITVSVDEADLIESADLTLTFPTVVSLGTPATTPFTTGCLVSGNITAPGTVRLALACPMPPLGPGVLMTIPVQATGVGGGPLQFTACSLVEDTVPCATPGGSTLTVVPPTPTPTVTQTFTRTSTFTATATATPTATRTSTSTRTATNTATHTNTPTVTFTPSNTRTATATRTSTFTRTPTAAPIGVPTITAPSAGLVSVTGGVNFAWTAVAGATAYDVRITNGASATVFSGSLTGNGATSTLISLPQNGAYTVSVRACAAAGCGVAATRGFSVSLAAPSAAPTVVAPANGSQVTASVQSLQWTAVSAGGGLPVFYEVRLTHVTTGTVDLQITLADPTLSTVTSLRGGNYRLEVRACQIACGPYSAPSNFTANIPTPPTIAPTITNATVQPSGNALNIAWTSVAGAEWYQLYVIQPPPAGPGGSALTVAARQVVGTSISGLLVPNGAASVIVAACTGNGCGPFSGAAPVAPGGANPGAPQLGQPLAGSVVDGTNGVMFTWSRVPGDDGSNTSYRLYVQDLSRGSAALDVITTQNFYAAFLKAEGARYDALVVARPGTGQEVVGPASGFTVRGANPGAPTLVAPTHNSSVVGGNVTLGWTPLPGATLYEYYVAAVGVASFQPVRGVTPGLLVQVPLLAFNGQPQLYSSIVRACPSGATCAAGSDAGWGPWSNVAGTGVVNFTVTP